MDLTIFRIVLLLDNAPTHPAAEKLNLIDDKCQIVYFVPNVTSLIQPMDQGVISAVKRHYKTGFLRELLACQHEDKASALSFVKKWSVFDCMKILQTSWSSITTSTLRNSWKKLIPTLGPSTSVISPSNDELLHLVNKVPGGNVLGVNDVADWLSQEHNLPVFEKTSDQQFLNLYASIQLPLQDTEESLNSDDEGVEETIDEAICTSTPSQILKATQNIMKWTRKTMHLTDEENLILIKIRDHALDIVMSGNQ